MKDYIRYSGMAFELLVLLLILVFLGKKVDAWLGFSKPVAMIIFILLGVAGYLVKLYYELTKKKKK